MKIVIVGAGLAAATRRRRAAGGRPRGTRSSWSAPSRTCPTTGRPSRRACLLGTEEQDSIFVHDAQWYADHDVDLRLGTTVTGIDLDRRRVRVGEEDLPYDRLLLATGSRPRRLDAADRSGGRVAYLRTLEDSLALRSAFGPDRHVVDRRGRLDRARGRRPRHARPAPT